MPPDQYLPGRYSLSDRVLCRTVSGVTTRYKLIGSVVLRHGGKLKTFDMTPEKRKWSFGKDGLGIAEVV